MRRLAALGVWAGLVWLGTRGLAAGWSEGWTPLRFLAPVSWEGSRLGLRLTSEDPAVLTPDRAARVSVLTTGDLGVPLAEWRVVASAGTLEDGVLRFEHGVDAGSVGRGFFVAREAGPTVAVTVRDAVELRAAVANARPGTRILLAPGVYPGGFYFERVRGEPGRPIVLAAADGGSPPVIQGGANGMQFADPEWLELEDLVFTGATGNGLNVDDGGSFATPARQIVLRRLRVSDVGPTGNRDGIKLSGVVDFRIEDCTIERWGTGGSAIDMVGCHRGLILGNRMRHTPEAAVSGANGVQAKGGTREVVVRRNRFEQVGARGVNIGGSTGLEFFRPPLEAGAEHGEAKDIVVEGNTFLGGTAMVAFVGVDGAVVRFNTFYRPERWVVRILQETTAPGFVPCRNGLFTDNLVAFHSSTWVSGGVNVGPQTAPATFQFARNWWYCLDAPARSRPALPVPETAGVYGEDPGFLDEAAGDLRLRPDSPARGVGAEAWGD